MDVSYFYAVSKIIVWREGERNQEIVFDAHLYLNVLFFWKKSA